MKSKVRRIRDLAPSKRSHPVYSDIIQREGWAPYVMCDSADVYWDGSTVRDRNDRTIVAISDPAKEQMINMILDGYFGEDVKDMLLDPHRWQRIYDDLVDVPIADVIARESLRVFDFRQPNWTATGMVEPDAKDLVSASGATTGPRPSSWSSVVERKAGQASFTYAFQFGDRDLWKIGHAIDLRGRLVDVNKHVPHEVLGEQWRLVLHHPWPTEVDAYKMEQRVLEALRTSSSVGERVACTRQALEHAWTSALGPDPKP